MAIVQAKTISFHSHHHPQLLPSSPTASTSSFVHGQLKSPACKNRRKCLRISCTYEDDYLIDAPVSEGDGFSFFGGKYSDGSSPADEWFKQGKIVKAVTVSGSGETAKDPIFGLDLGSASQADEIFRWFCVESGNADNHTVLLIHGFPSQAYSYRKVLPVLSKNYHAIAFDWPDKLREKICLHLISTGFGFSEKPQPGYGFDYNLDGDMKLKASNFLCTPQGYFSPVVVKYASKHKDKLKDLILLNPPVGRLHYNFYNTQDPLRASDKALTSCGPYQMKEDDAMVYRSPYLSSGSSGFALTAISRGMKKQLKQYVEEMRTILMDNSWKIPTTVCWGQRDRWLNYDGVEDFCNNSNHELIELPMVESDISHALT
ncbi:AB hydrolase-1 domain-containing protein [Citrus sinensis]|nr:AB hydrolase-1 domain-containing protein [Citrus sinensis]